MDQTTTNGTGTIKNVVSTQWLDVDFKRPVWASGDMGELTRYLYALPVTGQSLSVGVTAVSEVITPTTLTGAYLYNGMSSVGALGNKLDPSDITSSRGYFESTQTQGHSLITTLHDKVFGDWLYMSHGKGSSSVEEFLLLKA